LDDDLDYWVELCLDFNPKAKSKISEANVVLIASSHLFHYPNLILSVKKKTLISISNKSYIPFQFKWICKPGEGIYFYTTKSNKT